MNCIKNGIYILALAALLFFLYCGNSFAMGDMTNIDFSVTPDMQEKSDAEKIRKLKIKSMKNVSYRWRDFSINNNMPKKSDDPDVTILVKDFDRNGRHLKTLADLSCNNNEFLPQFHFYKTYDKNGNLSFNAHRFLISQKKSVPFSVGTLYRYDAFGRLAREYRVDGKNANLSNTYDYDAEGRLKEICSYRIGTTGKNSIFSRIIFKRGEKGLEILYCDNKGKTVYAYKYEPRFGKKSEVINNGHESAISESYEYDDAGNMVLMRRTSMDGKWRSRTVYVYNSRNLEIASYCIGTRSSKRLKFYDEKDRLVEEQFFRTAERKSGPRESGWKMTSRTLKKYDASGNEIEEITYKDDGEISDRILTTYEYYAD